MNMETLFFYKKYDIIIKTIRGESMSLINCPKCGKEISDRGQICPYCKTWLNEGDNPVFQKPSKVYLIQGIVFLIIAIALMVFGLCASTTGGVIFIGLGIFVLAIAVVSFHEHKKAVHKYRLANTDYAAYEQYIKIEREKERETQEFLQKQKEENEARKYNNYKYKCPMCGSNKVANISTVKKVVSVEILGLASDKIGKTYQCDECKYMW